MSTAIAKESLPEALKAPAQEQPSLGALYLAGPVLPICSPSFYRHAARRSAFAALLFFVLFALVVAALQAVRVTADFGEARQAIDDAFARGAIPEVTIAGGEATVHAPQPFVVVDDGRALVVLDTTGAYTGRELLDGGYETGVILTRDALYSFDDQGRFNQVSLRELEQVFPFPITFNAKLLKRFIDLAQVFVFGGLLFWQAVLGPLYVILLGLGVWAVASLAREQVSFSTVLVSGFYAAIPARYAEYLLNRIDLEAFLLYTLLLLIFWTAGLVAAAGARRAGAWLRGERTLRAWRAVIGAPMLLVFALDVIYEWPRGAEIVWATAVVTVAVLLVVGYRTGLRLEAEKAPPQVAPQG